MATTKIIIAGIGGVGGYFGGLLAKQYHQSTSVEVHFMARGQHLKAIQEHGLKVIKGNEAFIARPKSATEHPSDIGIADIILITTKSYDLDAMIQQLQPCIAPHTILLPLLNGVNHKEKIKTPYPDNTVLDGCVYIVSRLKEAGIVENSGNIQKLFFGLDAFVEDRLLYFEQLFKNASIEATLSSHISTVIWEKFIFLSPIATATSYYDKCIGAIIEDSDSFKTTISLIEEVQQIAHLHSVAIPDDITQKTIAKITSLPFSTTSSMHTDFIHKKAQTELDTLTGYVIQEAEKHQLSLPTYFTLYQELRKRISRSLKTQELSKPI